MMSSHADSSHAASWLVRYGKRMKKTSREFLGSFTCAQIAQFMMNEETSEARESH